jgi:hypothetical protein
MTASSPPSCEPQFQTLEVRTLLSFAPTGLATATAATRPTIQSLALSPASLTQGAVLTLVARGPTAGAGGALAAVEFYRDADANGRFDKAIDPWIASDRSPRHGWQSIFATAALPGGVATFFARARDAAGNCSKPAVASATILAPLNLVANYRGAISFRGDGQDTLIISIGRQKSGHVTGSLEQVGNGMTFDLEGDLGRNNTFTLTFSNDAGSGTATGNISADGRRMTGAFTSHIAGKTYTGTFGVKRYRISAA